MGFSGLVSLISLSGCSRVALSSVCAGYCDVLGFPVFGSFFDTFLYAVDLLVFTTPNLSCMYVISGSVKSKWIKTVGGILWGLMYQQGENR